MLCYDVCPKCTYDVQSLQVLLVLYLNPQQHDLCNSLHTVLVGLTSCT